MKGYVYRITPTGPKVLREIADVDWFRSYRDIVDFMRGPNPAEAPRRSRLDEMLEEVHPSTEPQTPSAMVVETVVLGKGMGAYVGETAP